MSNVSDPSANFATITPSDLTVNNFSSPTRAIYVGGTGDITAVSADTGVVVTFKAVPVGAILPIRASRINATATTASLLVGLF